MKVVRESDVIDYNIKSVITVGTFDGVHLGHKEIIKVVNSIKNKNSLRSVVVTFDPHPQIVLRNKAKDIKLLTTIEEKLQLFEKLDIDFVYIINFTREFAETPAEKFIQEYLVKKIGLTDLVIGYDHMFGKNREGSIDTVKKLSEIYSFSADMVNEYKINGEIVSSTSIRKYLLEGNILKANSFLGRQYSIEGIVIDGYKRGKELGYPTANLKLDSDLKLIPQIGIYAVSVEINNELFYGMMSIGYNPTVSSEKKLNLEVNIFDFDKNIYGERIKINFIDYIRKEIKFDSLNELKLELTKDKEIALNKIKKTINNN